MRDGVVAAETDQRIAGCDRTPDMLLDQIPGIGGVVEMDIAEIDEPARRAEVDARLAADAVGIGIELAPD